jgi:pimeloyl-ACP methyl ester carboxylesterase
MKFFTFFGMLLFMFNAFSIEIPKGFEAEKIDIDGVAYNVYKGGTGEPLLLIHGYAQSALMWSPVMKALKDRYTIIVPDIRGIGKTQITKAGYDKVTVAGDMIKILDHYQITKARVVGHDIGLMIAYAVAAKYPTRVEKLVVMDAFLPGIGPGEAVYNSPGIWHFRFYGAYPEKLVAKREYIFMDSLWSGFSYDPKTFSKADKKYYVKQYSAPGRMRAGWEYFKAIPKDAEDNKELAKTKLPMPVLVIGGDSSMGTILADTMKVVSDNLKVYVIPHSGHWLLSEKPNETIEALKEFL